MDKSRCQVSAISSQEGKNEKTENIEYRMKNNECRSVKKKLRNSIFVFTY